MRIIKQLPRSTIYRGAAYRVLIVIFFLTLLIIPARAYGLAEGEDGDLSLKFTGYYKNILAYSEPVDFPLSLLLGIPPNPFFDPGEIDDTGHLDNLSRLRLRLNGRYGQNWSGEAHGELRGLAMRPDIHMDSFFAAGGGARRWLDMEAVVYEEPGYQITGFVDRLWVGWTPDWGEILVGRQAITWTVGHLWFPMDRFGPFLPFDIEQDEKVGVDAVNVALNLGALAEFRVIFAPLDPFEDDRAGARLQATIWGFDLHLMGGYFSEEYVGGMALAHNLFGAVARAEFAYSHPLSHEDDRWSAIAGVDGSLPGNIYLLIEYYHQSGGENDADNYYKSFPRYLAGDLFGLAQDYIGATARWTVRPELLLSILGIVNLNDASSFISPQVEYDYGQNIKIILASSIFVQSNDDSEFGLFPNVYYLSFKGYF